MKEETRKQIHLIALSRAENAKDIGDCTVVRIGWVVDLIMEERARAYSRGYFTGIEDLKQEIIADFDKN
jgi:hydrogenase maturation factor